MKINENTMREQYDGQYKTFCKKNSDYGNSFEESLDKHGIVASIVRMGDKMNRLEALTDDSRTQQVGSESLLDTLEDLSNYAALTACWLKGIRDEDEVSGPDMEDAIKYNVQDAKETVEFRATLDKPFKPLGREVVYLPEPKEYILKMLDDINRVVQMKLEKDELLVPMDISDEAGLIAKCIVQSGTHSESISIIKDYLFDNSKNIPFEIREWIYGVIMRHFYYINKEHNERVAEELEKFKEHFNETLESNANCISIKHAVEVRLISQAMNGIMVVLVPNILAQRNPKYDLDTKLTQANQRNEWYKEIANLILHSPELSFDGFSGYVDTFRELMPDEKQLIKESVATEIYSQTDKNPGSDEESEFRSKKFHIPDETLEDLKEPEEEPKNIYEELEELFIKQNEHIKVLLTSGAGKTDITPLAILDYKNKTSESVNGYDLMVALDCLVPNLTKEGLEHFIKVANDALAKKE